MPRHARRPLASAALAALAICLTLAAARAADDQSPIQFMLQSQQRAVESPVRHSAPAFVRPHVRRPVADRRPIPYATADRRAPPRVAVTAAPAPTRVTVYGDRFAQALAGGLEDGAVPNVATTSLAGEDQGLARSDFRAWLDDLATRLKASRQPGVAIIMLGSNDRQAILDGGVSLDPASDRWREVYGKRVGAVAAAFRDAHVPLIWVGLPTVQGEAASTDYVRLNGIIRDAAERQGATYVDSWEAFSDDAGRYSPIGPDIDGRTVRLRKADGIGFTRAGARKLASFVTGEIKRLRGPAAKPAANPDVANITIERTRDFDQALDIDINAQIRREAGLAPSSAKAETPPAQAVAGPVLPLTAPPISPDGQLATVVPPSATMQARLQAPPTTGSLPPATPKPGRADDFSWPRP